MKWYRLLKLSENRSRIATFNNLLFPWGIGQCHCRYRSWKSNRIMVGDFLQELLLENTDAMKAICLSRDERRNWLKFTALHLLYVLWSETCIRTEWNTTPPPRCCLVPFRFFFNSTIYYAVYERSSILFRFSSLCTSIPRDSKTCNCIKCKKEKKHPPVTVEDYSDDIEAGHTS